MHGHCLVQRKLLLPCADRKHWSKNGNSVRRCGLYPGMAGHGVLMNWPFNEQSRQPSKVKSVLWQRYKSAVWQKKRVTVLRNCLFRIIREFCAQLKTFLYIGRNNGVLLDSLFCVKRCLRDVIVCLIKSGIRLFLSAILTSFHYHIYPQDIFWFPYSFMVHFFSV